MDWLSNLFADDTVMAALSGLLALALLDLITGISAGFRTKTFDPSLLGLWVQTHLIGRVLPIGATILLGHYSPVVIAFGATALALYTAETLASIKNNLMLPPDAVTARKVDAA